jgi:hypothetical protein
VSHFIPLCQCRFSPSLRTSSIQTLNLRIMCHILYNCANATFINSHVLAAFKPSNLGLCVTFYSTVSVPLFSLPTYQQHSNPQSEDYVSHFVALCQCRFSLSLCTSRIQTLNLRVMCHILYHCAIATLLSFLSPRVPAGFKPSNLGLCVTYSTTVQCHISLSLHTSSIQTLNLRIMCHIFYHCAYATFLYPLVPAVFKPSILGLCVTVSTTVVMPLCCHSSLPVYQQD